MQFTINHLEEGRHIFEISFFLNFCKVDYLQQANHDLEKQLHQHKLIESESIILQKDLQERNDELCTELAALNKVYKNLAKEKKKGDGEVDDQIETLRLELEEKQQNIFDLQANMSMIKKVVFQQFHIIGLLALPTVYCSSKKPFSIFF